MNNTFYQTYACQNRKTTEQLTQKLHG